MLSGILAGLTWALDTVILGIALGMTPFVTPGQAMVLAPLVSTFLHDAFSSIWMLIYMGMKKQYKNVLRALKTKSGKFIILGALLGGPIGMSGYVASINYMGPAYAAIISSLFPAVGAVLAYVFLKEKMSLVQVLGLVASICGVIILGYSPDGGQGKNMLVGFLCGLVCCFGWAAEAVICAYGLKDPDITDEQALQIRQVTSAIVYGAIILVVIKGWPMAVSVLPTLSGATILLAALFGTASYIFYYRAIATIGASRSMALNITYAAWSIVFSLLFLHTLPDLKSMICAVVVVIGSLIAAKGITFGGKKETV